MTTPYSTPAIVCDADKLSQIAIIQDLGRLGVPVTAVAPMSSAIGFASRFVRQRIILPVPSYQPQYVPRLVEAAPRGVLFYSNDANTENIAKSKQELVANGFFVLVADSTVLDSVINKDRLYTTAAACGIAVPASIPVHSSLQLQQAAREIGYPLILKSTNLAGGVYKFVACPDDLESAYHEMEHTVKEEEFRHRDARLIVQQWIPQQDTELWNFNACVRSGEIVSYSLGRRIRSNRKPDGSIGSTLLYGQTAHNDRILECNQRLMKHLRFDGLLETEWSQSTASPGKIYLYDFNPRPSGNIRWALKSGAPLVEDYYRLALGLPPVAPRAMRAGVKYFKLFWKDTDYLEALANPSLSRRSKAAIVVMDFWGLLTCRRHAIDIFDPWDLAPTARALQPFAGSARRKLRRLVEMLTKHTFFGTPKRDHRTGGVA